MKEIEIEPPPLNNILKADAVAKRGNDTRVGMRTTANRRWIDAFVRGCIDEFCPLTAYQLSPVMVEKPRRNNSKKAEELS